MKHAQGRFLPDLVDEHARLLWLSGRLPVPAIRAYLRQDDSAWLVTDALPGRTAEAVFDSHPDRRLVLVHRIAAFMRRMHAIPAHACPFDSSLPRRLAVARSNIDAGLVDQDDFDAERQGWTAEQVWVTLQAELPLTGEHVVTHGDFSLGNLLIDGDEVSGCIDVGRAGLADPYQDLAILWNCLRDYGEGVADALWSSYGMVGPDQSRLQVHLLLDELF